MMTEKSVNRLPAMNTYHEARLTRGMARSFAPSASGRRKLPSVAGIDGTRKNQIMMIPWIEKKRL